jgi:enamine deaminase RidA (YjgF/YER057c/UK114 family)
MIKRLNPDVDYVDPAWTAASGLSHAVEVNGLVFLSGLVALHHDGDGLGLIGADDPGAQIEYVLGVLERLLDAVGSSRKSIVAWTLYCTDIDRVDYTASLGRWVGEHGPAAAIIGVSRLGYPGLMVELSVTAAKEER